jgi:hypothetical protein
MSYFSVNNLKPIFSTPLSLSLARGSHKMTDEDAEYRIVVALHEAAHYAAAIACPKTSILGVSIYAPFSNTFMSRQMEGQVRAMSVDAEHDAFGNFVGLAWEELHGDITCAVADEKAGKAHAKYAAGRGDPEEKTKEILDKARRFVVLADQPIRWAAVGLLGLIPKSGELTRDKTARLSEALRPKVPPYWRV